MSENKIDTLWDKLRTKSRGIETNLDPLERKRTGSYYTDLELTDAMMAELIGRITNDGNDIVNMRFLEPCVGSGNFVFSYIKLLYETNLKKEEAKTLLDNIYVADINSEALAGYESSLRDVARQYWELELEDSYFDKHIGSGLLVDLTKEHLSYADIKQVFPEEVVKNGFDIVVTNPPYKNLKAERGHYNDDAEYEADKKKYAEIKSVVNGFKYSTDGVLNLYKLFVEEIIDRYASENAYVSLLIPSSILSDKTCYKLRTHILNDHELMSVKIISENSGYIDAQQALCTLLIKTGSKTKSVNITKDYCMAPAENVMINIEDILDDNNGNSIIALSEEEYHKLKLLKRFPCIKELDCIVNLRGELDLTANKKYIAEDSTDYPLLRGRNIGYYKLLESNEKDYVDEEFLKVTGKHDYITNNRIICQQIANMHKERRITFAFCPANYILGNSCNFISVKDNNYGLDIYALLGLLNTKIINWFFKLTSSNNHVNNYEIDCFPIPTNSPELCQISKLVKLYLSDNNESLIEQIESLAEVAYGIESKSFDSVSSHEEYDLKRYVEEIKYIIPTITEEDAKSIISEETSITDFCSNLTKFEKNVAEGITKKHILLAKGMLLNHTTFKLSDLDLEMIKSVPPGGSWKDIPPETVEKSQRLKKITQTGGRTTLYGRIDYNKPSYTITTYFNRPGNGTYVHPRYERVISVREAARFQGFVDDYYFFGNKSQTLKQVGNAVPTILAYQIGKNIVEKTGCTNSVDLFCGAGGMTAGFKAAGIKALISNDIEESACTTLKINNPEIPVLCGDITTTETKDSIERAAKIGGADIICGGPPCQGFSMAGFRSETDPRNQLFREFVDIVKRVDPKVIVFENVEGLLSYQGGKTYREVLTLFSELGYTAEGRTLIATNYAVPQKRKRVIIICTRNDIGIEPSLLFPKEITSEEESQITAKETIFDLDSIECSENALYTGEYTSNIIDFFKGRITYDQYIEKYASSSNESEVEAGEYMIMNDGQIRMNF